jgi:hypothetical protein
MALLKQNIGNLSALSSPFPGVIKRMITTPKGFSLSAANSIVQAQWQNAILDTPAKRIYLWPSFRSFDNASEKFVYDKTDLSVMPVRDGIPEFDFTFLESIYLHKAMRSHTGTSPCRVFFIDNKNRIWGQTDPNANFVGYDVALLNMETIMWSNGKEASKSPSKIVMVDNSQWDDNGAFVDAKSFVNFLLPLTAVTLKQSGVLAANTIVVSVTAADGTSIDGLVFGDFKLTSVGGANHAVTAAVQDAQTGLYSLTSATAVATDILSLISAATLSIPGYEAPVTIAIA